MNNKPKPSPATNVLYNEEAMAILARARKDIEALGLHTTLGPSLGSDDLDQAAALTVSTADESLLDRLARSLVIEEYLATPEGLANYQKQYADLAAWGAVGKASHQD